MVTSSRRVVLWYALSLTFAINLYAAEDTLINDRFNDLSRQRKTISHQFIWDTKPVDNKKSLFQDSRKKILLKEKQKTHFTSLGIGLDSKLKLHLMKNFIIKVRTKVNRKWSQWANLEIESTPADSPTGLYWTELHFTQDEQVATSFQVILEATGKSKLPIIDAITVETFDSTAEDSSKGLQILKQINSIKSNSFPVDIIPRSVWLDPYFKQPNYNSRVIEPTHVIIHYGATPNSYKDGFDIVRSYWKYHVYSKGWSDIGYNYLVDKFGNLFVGRKNTQITLNDVRGAHAGNANSDSIGLNFIGNTDVIPLTNTQLNKAYQFLAWWFEKKGLDPTEIDTMMTQDLGTQARPRITGHRDVRKPGYTSCPGNKLHDLLPTMRSEVKRIIAGEEEDIDLQLDNVGNEQVFVSKVNYPLLGSVNSSLIKSVRALVDGWEVDQAKTLNQQFEINMQIFNPRFNRSLLFQAMDEENTVLAEKNYNIHVVAKDESYLIIKNFPENKQIPTKETIKLEGLKSSDVKTVKVFIDGWNMGKVVQENNKFSLEINIYYPKENRMLLIQGFNQSGDEVIQQKYFFDSI